MTERRTNDLADPAPLAEPEPFGDETARDLRILEALLFAADHPMDRETLADQLSPGVGIEDLLARLAEIYAGRGVNLCRVAHGWVFRTAPDLAKHLTVYRTVKRRPSRAALETLAIIAYHQPVTRAEIEEIRGVGLSRGTLDLLLEADWIKPKGRRRAPGRPITWVTTAGFLDHFGLDNLDDLPGVDELKAAGLLRTGDVGAAVLGELTADETHPDPDPDPDAQVDAAESDIDGGSVEPLDTPSSGVGGASFDPSEPERG